MDVTREVIMDLLPVYLMGEASPDTRALVEDFLRRDPELAERVRANATSILDRGAGATPALSPDLELRSVARTRAVLDRLRWLFSLGFTFTSIGLCLRLTFSNGRLAGVGFVVFDYPQIFAPCLVLGLGFLAAYFTLRHRLGSGRR